VLSLRVSSPASLHALRQSSPSVEAFRLLHATFSCSSRARATAAALHLPSFVQPDLFLSILYKRAMCTRIKHCHSSVIACVCLVHISTKLRGLPIPPLRPRTSARSPDSVPLLAFALPLYLHSFFPHRPSGYRTNRVFSSALTWPLPYKENVTM
jgi:hypothetical protein